MSDVVGQIALELGIDSSQIVNQLTGASNKAAKQATSIFSGMGKKIAAGLSIAAFTKFTKDCIEVGSNVTEVQNVVDTAFKDLSWQADQWASNAMTNFGLSELSAKKYMGVFGQMSNAMGITGKAALDMAENVTGLTGDVASFYNLSTDEAYTKLKSICRFFWHVWIYNRLRFCVVIFCIEIIECCFLGCEDLSNTGTLYLCSIT